MAAWIMVDFQLKVYDLQGTRSTEWGVESLFFHVVGLLGSKH